ncbi:MAG: hypothetical protein E7553_07610 [Ruminococcaceae bacterium]|nr:hypothetical protein [Oscillospiraceae bacterium]
MDAKTLREQYVTKTLANSIHGDPTPFYEAFEEGEDAMEAFFTHLWETLCNSEGESLADHPFFPDIMPYILEDTEDGFCAIVTLTLPKTPTAASVSGAVVFGSAMDPRVFAGVPVRLKNGTTLKIEEVRANGTREEVAVLYQGCDNGLTLFDAPNPQKRDADTPLHPARREAATVEAIVYWCMEHD